MIKKLSSIFLCIGCIMFAMGLSACGKKTEYIPKGKFYIKTSPSNGDAGVKEVIDIEAEYRTYQGEGDISVPVTIGFGHQPELSDFTATQMIFFMFYIKFSNTR